LLEAEAVADEEVVVELDETAPEVLADPLWVMLRVDDDDDDDPWEAIIPET
jgi:hypothetical protein